MYGIDIVALRWAIGIYIFFFVAWFIVAKKLLKSEPTVVKINLADRYDDISLNSYGIDSKKFKQMVYDNFVKIHSSFMNYDYDTIKCFVTMDLYDYYCEQLESLKNKGYKNIMSDFELVNVKIYNVMHEHGMLRINVYLNVRMYDYVIDINTNKCVKGNDVEKIDYEFELSFEKKRDVKKLNDQFLMSKKSCINDILVREDKKKDK